MDLKIKPLGQPSEGFEIKTFRSVLKGASLPELHIKELIFVA